MMKDTYKIESKRVRGGGSVTVPGSTTQIIYNNAGALGASSDLTWDGGSYTLTVGVTNGATIVFWGDLSFPTDGQAINFASNGSVGHLKAITSLSNNRDWEFPDVGGNIVISTATWPAVNLPGVVTIDGQIVANSAGTSMYSIGDIAVDDGAYGIILKDTAGTPHYWRVTVNTSGTLVTTDLGTTLP